MIGLKRWLWLNMKKLSKDHSMVLEVVCVDLGLYELEVRITDGWA